MDGDKNLPTLIGKLKIDWLDFPVDDILQQFTTLKEGILRGVFKQKAARAWFGCRAEKAQVTVLLPGNCSFSAWPDMVDCKPHSWPKSFNIGRLASTSIASSHVPDICGSSWIQIGDCCPHTCTLNGQGFTAMQKSMIASL